MKRYILPLSICFFWATPIQVSADDVCPREGSITVDCKNFFQDNLTEPNPKEVVECIKEIQNEAGNEECLELLKTAYDNLGMLTMMPGAARDTSPGKFLRRNILELEKRLK